MVSSSRNIPSRGGEIVSSAVGAVANFSNLRSATSRRTLYMHVHNCIRDGAFVANSGLPNDSYRNRVLAARIASGMEPAAGAGEDYEGYEGYERQEHLEMGEGQPEQ